MLCAIGREEPVEIQQAPEATVSPLLKLMQSGQQQTEAENSDHKVCVSPFC